MKKRERRLLSAQKLRVERRAEGTPTIVGYAAVFGVEADIGGFFREQLARGAFARALREKQDVRALFNHESGRVLGRSAAGTLRLEEDDHGLLVEIDPPDTETGREVVTLIERGDVSGMSFGFIAREEEWDEDLRTLLDVDLFDVSPVTFPAYAETEVGLRDAASAVLAARAGRIASAQKVRRMRLRLSEIA